MHNDDPLPTRLSAATAVWRSNGRLESTINVYVQWVRRYELAGGGVDALTEAAALAFATSYARRRRIPCVRASHAALCALKSWAYALRLAGYSVPVWATRKPDLPLPALLAEYATFRAHHAGVAPSTNAREMPVLIEFLGGIPDGSVGALRIRDIDDHITALATRASPKTVARVCSSIRSFLRFLHLTGRIDSDLAESVAGPAIRAMDQPPRALPWDDVVRLLAAIDTGGRTGRRDYALLLLMATYGMGSAEVLRLQLADIDWRAGTLHVVRPKTGADYLLPLLAGPAEALLAYLRDGRPQQVATRALFVGAVAPHGPMSSSAVRFSVRTYAHLAGLSGARLGGHVLRHSHACRQIELAAPPSVVSAILGHRDPRSTSSYFRVATERLRELALPVPR